MFKNIFLLIVFALVCNLSLLAKDRNKKKDSISHYKLSNISIITDKSITLSSVPGSVSLINREQIKSESLLNCNEILRTVSGINIVDEEGAGLRMNLGLRGLDPDRSRTLLVLEDGVPVSLAPYGEPEMYYTPLIDRMNSIEVLKGSGSIIYGPQTIGGVLNFITKEPPMFSESDFDLTLGTGGFVSTKFSHGNSSNGNGFIAEIYHKSADKIGLTNYDIYDFMAKGKFRIDNTSNLSVKVGLYDESSNSTYVGITQSMYDRGDYFTEIAPNDLLTIRRYSLSLNYQKIISPKLVFNTSAFAYNTSRYWRRQDFGRASNVSNKTGVIFGDTSVAGGAIYMRNTTGNRDRAFEVIGVQPSIISEFDLSGIKNELHIGARILHEKAAEQRINGSNSNAVSGSLVEDEDRLGLALSGFIQNRAIIAKDFVITTGLRYEFFDYTRDIFRISSKDTAIKSSRSISEIIPGIGINYNLNDKLSIFGGMHRGFAPPRTKDAITNDGTTLDLAAELSWNYEIGFRSYLTDFLNLEATVYRLDFSNQIIPVSESSGHSGFGLVNGGSTLHQGIEMSFNFNFSNLVDTKDKIDLTINTTISDSKFNSDRFIGSEKVNIKDNKLPYAPNMILSGTLNYHFDFGLNINLNASFIGNQFTDELNTIKPSTDGTIGEMGSYYLVNLTVKYKLFNSFDVFLSAKNLTDEVYIASRRPQGIKVGIPRLIMAGLDFNF